MELVAFCMTHLFVVWFCRYWTQSRLLSSSSILRSFCIFPESLLHSCVCSNCGGYQHVIIFYCLILSVEMAQDFLYDISTFTKKIFSWGLSKISDIPAGVLIVNFQCDCIHWSVPTFSFEEFELNITCFSCFWVMGASWWVGFPDYRDANHEFVGDLCIVNNSWVSRLWATNILKLISYSVPPIWQ